MYNLIIVCLLCYIVHFQEAGISNSWKLVGYVSHKATYIGLQEVYPDVVVGTVSVKAGDALGIYWPGSNPIPMNHQDSKPCTSTHEWWGRQGSYPWFFNAASSIKLTDVGIGYPCRDYSFQVDVLPSKQHYS